MADFVSKQTNNETSFGLMAVTHYVESPSLQFGYACLENDRFRDRKSPSGFDRESRRQLIAETRQHLICWGKVVFVILNDVCQAAAAVGVGWSTVLSRTQSQSHRGAAGLADLDRQVPALPGAVFGAG